MALHRAARCRRSRRATAAGGPAAARPSRGRRRRSPGCAGTSPAGRRPGRAGGARCRRVRRSSRFGGQQVDQPLGVAQLGGRHPVELAVPVGLRRAVGPLADHRSAPRRRRRRPLRPPRRCRSGRLAAAARRRPGRRRARARRRRPPRTRPRPASAGSAGSGRRPAGTGRGRARTGRRPRRRPRGRRAGGRTPRRPAERTCSRSPRSTSPSAAREVDRGAEIGRQPRQAERAGEADRVAGEPLAVDDAGRVRPPGSGGSTWRGSGVAGTGSASGSAAGDDLVEHPPAGLAADVPDVLLVLEDDAERLVDELRAGARSPRGRAAPTPSRASRPPRAPWSGRPRGGDGRSRRSGRPAAPGHRAPGSARSRARAGSVG